MEIKVNLVWEQFHLFFGESVVVRHFSKAAQKAIFKHIHTLQKEDETAVVNWTMTFINAIESTASEVYARVADKITDMDLNGPLLDLLLEGNHSELAAKINIPLSENHPDYDENRSDSSYLEEHYDLLMNDHAFADGAVSYFNDHLDKPYIKLSNGKWLAFDYRKEEYSKTN